MKLRKAQFHLPAIFSNGLLQRKFRPCYAGGAGGGWAASTSMTSVLLATLLLQAVAGPGAAISLHVHVKCLRTAVSSWVSRNCTPMP